MFWSVKSLCGLQAADGEKETLQSVVRSAGKTVGCHLPSLDDITGFRCLFRSVKIIQDLHHPAALWSEVQEHKSRTNRMKNSFFPWAVRTLNTHSH